MAYARPPFVWGYLGAPGGAQLRGSYLSLAFAFSFAFTLIRFGAGGPWFGSDEK